MNLSKAVVSGLCAWGMSLPALAQAPATTITIGDLPPLGGDRNNRLASVTITENRPDAIRDGTFILYFPDNPDQTVEFQPSTTVSGPASARAATNYLVIDVDSDDSATETIVIQPEAYFRTRLPYSPAFALQDGDPMRMNPTGVLDGVAIDRFELGTLGDIIALEIGFEEDVQVGQTIVQDILTAEGENTGPYTAETLNPAVASAVVDGDTVRITGLTPGTTHALVHDSLGRQDMMVVNVLPAPGSDLTAAPPPQEAEPEPELEAAVPVTPSAGSTVGFVPEASEPEGSDEASPAPTEAESTPDLAGSPNEETASGQVVGGMPAPEQAAAAPEAPSSSGSGANLSNGSSGVADGNTAGSTDSGSESASTPSLASQEEGAPSSQSAASVELPRLPDPAVMGGGTSTAIITAGATADGSNFRGSFANGEQVSIAGEILPEVAQVNQDGDLFVAVRVTGSAGSQAWFQRGSGGWTRWNGSLGALDPVRSGALQPTERLEIFEGALRPGRYEIYMGYAAEGDALVYSGEPLVVEVSE